MKKIFNCFPGVIIVAGLWLGISLWCFFKPADDFSDSERRPLASFPETTVQSVFNGDFMKDFETYSLDQFPLRDDFRTLKALTSFFFLGKKDNNDIYISDGYAAKLEKKLDEESVLSASEKLTYIYNKYFKDTNANVFLSIVPDKNYFLADKNKYPSMDYNKLISIMRENMPYAKYIDVIDTLDISKFYKTDTHWRQEKILDTAEKILSALGSIPHNSYTTITTDTPFYGVYYGQSALPLPNDSISYLTNNILDNCKVKAYNSKLNKIVEIDMYSENLLHGKDPYEMFLYGATPVVTIENPSGTAGKELVIMRDSYASSIAPLLVSDYSKITLLDTRYISPNFLTDYIGNPTDVLFLYSTSIINQSNSLLKY